MPEPHEDHISRRAYEIWEMEGRPDGRHEDHWVRAVRELAAHAGTAALEPAVAEADAGGAAKPARKRARRKAAGAA